MSNITLRQARQNRAFKGSLELRLINGQGAFLLPAAAATYELRLYRHNNVTPFATATSANAKISIAVTAEATVVSYHFPATDMQGLLGYGSMELISSVVGSVPIVIPPLQFVKEDTPTTVEDGQKLVIFDETIVCIVNNEKLQETLSSVVVVVNVLAPGSAASAAFSANTLTLNVPRGDTGSNGVMSAAEVAKGQLALTRVASELLGKKAVVLDFVSGGYAQLDDAAAHELRSIENIPGLVVTNATGGKRITRKKALANVAANLLRYAHGIDGAPLGILIEASHNYANRQSQPTIAQCDEALSTTDTVAPTGWSGTWTAFGDNTIVRTRRNLTNYTTGSDIYLQCLVRMTDGLAPVANDFDFSFAGLGVKHPDTAASGLKITGPFLNDVYLVQAFATATATISGVIGVAKNTTNTIKTFSLGPWNYGPGRYPPSLFDNVTAAPNNRNADFVSAPLSGFTSDEITIAGIFVCPPPKNEYRFLVAMGDGNNSNSISLDFDPLVNKITLLSMTAGVQGYNNQSAYALVPGSKYKFAISISKSKKTALHSFNAGAGVLSGSFTPPALYVEVPLSLLTIGSRTDGYFLDSSVEFLALIDRAWTSAEIASWVG
jgi:hypothetical protein